MPRMIVYPLVAFLLALVFIPMARAKSDFNAGASKQLVVVTTKDFPSTSGTLRRFEMAHGKWTEVGDPIAVQVGKSGLGWGRGRFPKHTPFPAGPTQAEGDGRAPAGVFPLLEVTGYADQPPEGTRMPYRQATERLRCVDDVGSPEYNHVVLAPEDGPGSGKTPWKSDEKMKRQDALYEFTIVVGYNTDKPRPGDGSCIFVHVQSGPMSPTVGCTSMTRADLLRLIAFLDPKKEPLLVQMPLASFRGMGKDSGLPWNAIKD